MKYWKHPDISSFGELTMRIYIQLTMVLAQGIAFFFVNRKGGQNIRLFFYFLLLVF